MARRRVKKKSKWPSYIMMAIMVLIMVGSFGTVMLYAPQTSQTYNGQEYEYDNNLQMIVTELDGQQLRFHSQVTSAQAVPYNESVTALLQNAQMPYVTFNPTNTFDLEYYDVVRYELALAFPAMAGGMTQSSEQYDLPQITCTNASAQTPVIKLEQGAPSVSLDGNCVVVSGNATSIVLAKDALLYNYYGLV